MALLELKQLG
ncbi:Protein of unknown function [Bacillus mycoides]|nr:Protein of unknown function [Bacillus mycoides]